MKRITTATVAAACIVGLVLPIGPASAKGGDEIRNAGSCTGRTTWELKAKARDGGIEVEYEVDSNRVGQVWRWSLHQNGVRVAAGRATTKAPSGSFSVERRLPNRSGVDTFAGRARNLQTGEVCRGSLRF